MTKDNKVHAAYCNPFTQVEGLQIITTKGGVQKQLHVFVRDDQLYVGIGGGYVTLYADGGTTVPALRWKGFISEDGNAPTMCKSALNHLMLGDGA